MSNTPDMDALLAKAEADHRAGRLAAAVDGYRRVLGHHGDVADLHVNLGVALKGLGQVAAAEASYRRAIELDPDSLAGQFNLANLLREDGRAVLALDHYRRALAVAPGSVQVRNNLGATLYDLGDIDAAVATYRDALALAPDNAEALNNMGNVLQRLGRLDEAERHLRAAVAASTDDATLRLNLGGVLQVQGRYDEAMAEYDRALTIDPGHIKTRLKRGTLMALRGDWRNGFAEYLWRWKDPMTPPRPPLPGLTRWNGDPLDGDGILLWSEQGYGDAIHLSRYAPQVAARGGRTVLAVPPALVPIMTGMTDMEVVANPAMARTPLTHEASLMDLPHLFASTPDNVPNAVPYLGADAATVAQWSTRLGPPTLARRVGVIWAGNPSQPHDYTRTIGYQNFRQIFKIDGTSFYSLQVGTDGIDRTSLADDGVIDLAPELTNFAETAAAMASLDLIISVDSAPAHLAGAIGKPVWILLSFDPDCRWLLDRDDSPWYPTARLFRQPTPGDWQSVLQRVTVTLSQRIDIGTR